MSKLFEKILREDGRSSMGITLGELEKLFKRAESHESVDRDEFRPIEKFCKYLSDSIKDLSEEQIPMFCDFAEGKLEGDDDLVEFAFFSEPSADQMHYFSNGAPDNRKMQRTLRKLVMYQDTLKMLADRAKHSKK
jgi:hypothetical protein